MIRSIRSVAPAPTLLLLLLLLPACGGADGPSVPARFPAAVEATKSLASAGDVLGAVEDYKTLWVTFPEDVARDDAYKITLSVFDAVQSAPIESKAKVAPLIDLMHWAQAKHPAKSEAFARREPSILALGATNEQMSRIQSNPYLGGGKR